MAIGREEALWSSPLSIIACGTDGFSWNGYIWNGIVPSWLLPFHIEPFFKRSSFGDKNSQVPASDAPVDLAENRSELLAPTVAEPEPAAQKPKAVEAQLPNKPVKDMVYQNSVEKGIENDWNYDLEGRFVVNWL